MYCSLWSSCCFLRNARLGTINDFSTSPMNESLCLIPDFQDWMLGNQGISWINDTKIEGNSGELEWPVKKMMGWGLEENLSFPETTSRSLWSHGEAGLGQFLRYVPALNSLYEKGNHFDRMARPWSHTLRGLRKTICKLSWDGPFFCFIAFIWTLRQGSFHLYWLYSSCYSLSACRTMIILR